MVQQKQKLTELRYTSDVRARAGYSHIGHCNPYAETFAREEEIVTRRKGDDAPKDGNPSRQIKQFNFSILSTMTPYRDCEFGTRISNTVDDTTPRSSVDPWTVQDYKRYSQTMSLYKRGASQACAHKACAYMEDRKQSQRD
jgi:hypothetical protein